MDQPWLQVRQSSRSGRLGQWEFVWSIDELKSAPTILNWAEVVHPDFQAAAMEVNRRLPTQVHLVVSSPEIRNRVVPGAILKLGITWNGQKGWVASVPLNVRFDQNGHPETNPGEGQCERELSGLEAIRRKVLRSVHDHEEGGTSANVESEQLAHSLNITTRQINQQLEVLERGGLIELSRSMGGNHSALLTVAGRQLLEEGEVDPLGTTSVNIAVGAIIQAMYGGNLQAIGNAIGSEITQNINDPAQLEMLIEKFSGQLLEAVRTELRVSDFAKYAETVSALAEELKRPKPNESSIRRLFGALSFAANIEGSIGLMERVWPHLWPLLLLAAKLIGGLGGQSTSGIPMA